jgi:hypothetical protein
MDYSINIYQHPLDRLQERNLFEGGLTLEESEEVIDEAVRYGLKMNGIKSLRLKRYLNRISKKYGYVSDYRIIYGMIFVFNAFTSTIITVLSVPDYAPYEQHYGFSN